MKRPVATDLIVAEIDGDSERAIEALDPVEGVDEIEVHGRELSMSTSNGAAVIADVAVALNGCGVPIKSLTLRTPTLDDVFLNVTGDHLEGGFESGRATSGSTATSVPGEIG